MIITLEGMDGAGKTTQALHLVQWAEQSGRYNEVISMSHPKGTKLGRALYECLKLATGPECEVVIACAMHFSIQPLLEGFKGVRDNLIILDRYWMSTQAYQKPVGFSEQIFSLCCSGLVQPDLTCYLKINPGVSRQRKEGIMDPSESKFEDKPDDVNAQYEAMFHKLNSIHGAFNIQTVNAEVVESEVTQELIRLVMTEVA